MFSPASLGFEQGADTSEFHLLSLNMRTFRIFISVTFSFGASGGALGVTETTYQVMDNFSRVIKTQR